MNAAAVDILDDADTPVKSGAISLDQSEGSIAAADQSEASWVILVTDG